jgi:hypothetical protein
MIVDFCLLIEEHDFKTEAFPINKRKSEINNFSFL